MFLVLENVVYTVRKIMFKWIGKRMIDLKNWNLYWNQGIKSIKIINICKHLKSVLKSWILIEIKLKFDDFWFKISMF